MRLLHCHIWEEMSRFFTPPKTGPCKFSNLDPSELEKLVWGFITIELRCRQCGDIKIVSGIGNTGGKNERVSKD